VIMQPGFQLTNPDGIAVRTKDGRNFTALESFGFLSKSGELVTVPAGATSDGASTPRILWREIPPFGLYWLAAFLHDWLYRCSQKPKEECDNLLKEAMESLGVSEFETVTIYEGVHWGGQDSFNEDRKAQSCKM